MQCHETVTYVFHSSLAGWKMVEQTFVRRDAGPAKVAIESKRNVLTFPCGIKPYSTPVQRYKVWTFIQSDSVSLCLLRCN